MTLGPRAAAARRSANIAKETLPPGVFRSHGALYFITTEPGQDAGKRKNTWHRLGESWSEAFPVWKQLVLKHRSANYARKYLYADEAAGPIPVQFLREMLANAKKNAKARGLPCTLTVEDMQTAAMRTGGRCELTGIAFQYGQAKELAAVAIRRKRIWAPSLDRLNGADGYTSDNIRIVCMVVNVARQEFGDEILMMVAEGLIRRQKSSTSRPVMQARRKAISPSKFGDTAATRGLARAGGEFEGRPVNP